MTFIFLCVAAKADPIYGFLTTICDPLWDILAPIYQSYVETCADLYYSWKLKKYHQSLAETNGH